AAVVALTVALSRLEPALPSVDRDALLTGKVEFGEMIRQVRGNGTLVPEHVLVVPAEVPGHVVNILVMPGAAVPSNIAEGQARRSGAKFSRFLSISLGSLAELETQLILVNELGLEEEPQTEPLIA
ncbi:MAG: four helix bundle protein, partial [Planctomycetales bacterium]|nr:four helix bundle protein [Planctomycetales bacterium]